LYLRTTAEAAYQRGSLLRKRRALMDDWAAYCASSTTMNAPGSRREDKATALCVYERIVEHGESLARFPELGLAMVAAVEADRTWPADMRAWLIRQRSAPRWQLTEREALGLFQLRRDPMADHDR